MEGFNRNSTKLMRLDTDFDNSSRKYTDTNIKRMGTFEESNISNLEKEESEALQKEYEEY